LSLSLLCMFLILLDDGSVAQLISGCEE
jgi:hypothetical protein